MTAVDLHGNAHPHPLQIPDVFHRVHSQHILGLDVAEAQVIESVPGEFRIVADVGEQSAVEDAWTGTEIPNLGVNGRAVTASAEDPAQQVLLGEGGR